MSLAMATAAHAGLVRVKKTGPHHWKIESRAIEVSLDATRAAISVRDKRCGAQWLPAAVRRAGTTSWKMPRGARVKIDGEVAADEWPAPAIALGADAQTEGPTKPAPDDFSATVHAAWVPQRLLLAVQVRDDKPAFPKPGETKWWEWDSVEFWIDARQYAIIPAPPGGQVLLMGKGKVDGAAVKSRVVPGGWEVEAAIPWPMGAVKRAGLKMRFALGVNDADDAEKGGRKYQLYFPATWRHSAPETFAQTALAATGSAPTATSPQAALQQVRALNDGTGIQARGAVRSESGASMWTGTITVRIENDNELVVRISGPAPDMKTYSFTALTPLYSPQPVELYAARYCNGIAVRDADSRFRNKWWGCYGNLDMPWVGYGSATGPGYVLLFEDPDDGFARLMPVAPDGRLVPVPFHEPQKGKFGYPRQVRYAFLDRGGFVAMCNWYRGYAKRTGVLKTLREKMRIRPQLERIAGAPDFWGNTPEITFEMRRWGIRHAIVNGRWSRQIMERMKALGYLVSRYDNYEDMREGPRDQYGRGKIPDDVVKKADGSLMRGWITWDKKTVHMKRCSVLYEEVARLQIPKDLAEHPYNARFIDVTTACGLRECYDPNHPCTRTIDRKSRQRLANYIANELKLVLGGEHGRWWGVPYYDYWEGMQSGGFYSWPAGHVGINIPQKREDIGKMYLEFGIGEKRRVPLWELVFGDCTVSTWYWGDSTGHLYKAAPEIADRKDCFNLLYGTVPLYWTTRPFSFKWSDPKLRLRLLQSYFVTCPVHELVAFEELVDYRYLTTDRAVHQSKFANGVTVTVNFGPKPYQIRAAGRTFALPQFGFLVTGPGVLAYRALTVDDRTVTYVRTPSVIYADSGGKLAEFETVRLNGRVALEKEKDGRVRLIRLQGADVDLKLQGWLDGWQRGTVLVYDEDDQGRAARAIGAQWMWPWLRLKSAPQMCQLIAGSLARRPDVAVDTVEISPPRANQGENVAVRVGLRNFGRAAARGVNVRVYLDRFAADRLLAQGHTDLLAGAQKTVEISVDTSRIDGVHELLVTAAASNAMREISAGNNTGRAKLEVVVNPKLWPYQMAIEVDPGQVAREHYVVEAEVDLSAAGAPAAALDPSTVRVIRQGAEGVVQLPAEFQPYPEPRGKGGRVGILRFQDSLAAGKTQRYMVLVGTSKNRTLTTSLMTWDEQSQTVRTPAYEIQFTEGRIGGWKSLLPSAPSKPFLLRLVASDAAFGWSSEQGRKWELDCLWAGPVCVIIRAHKLLDGGFEYAKTYRFYPRYFIVEGEFNRRPSVWTRAAYGMPCHYADSAGNRAEIDGKGKAENVAGRAPGIKWYAAWTDTWAHSALNLSPPNANITYWDAGLLGEVGFSTAQAKGLRAAYVLHEGQKTADFAAADYLAFSTPVAVRIIKP